MLIKVRDHISSLADWIERVIQKESYWNAEKNMHIPYSKSDQTWERTPVGQYVGGRETGHSDVWHYKIRTPTHTVSIYLESSKDNYGSVWPLSYRIEMSHTHDYFMGRNSKGMGYELDFQNSLYQDLKAALIYKEEPDALCN